MIQPPARPPRQLLLPTMGQFWFNEQTGLWTAMNQTLLDAYYGGVEGGTVALPDHIKPLVDWDRVSQSAIDFTRQYRFSLIKDITDTTRQQTQDAITAWIQSGAPLPALDASLTPIYGDTRASLIAATEVTRAFAQGNLDAWESTGVVEGGTWMTARDERVCPICKSHDGETVGIGDIDSAPPSGSHPGCRCWLKPRVSLDMVKKRMAEALA